MSTFQAPQFNIPSGFPDILKDLTREILRDQPVDVESYCLSYFNRLKTKASLLTDGRRASGGGAMKSLLSPSGAVGSSTSPRSPSGGISPTGTVNEGLLGPTPLGMKSRSASDAAYVLSNMGLHEAARVGSIVRIAQLIEGAGIDVNSRDESGSSPLHEAARSGHEKVVQFLLSKGANQDLQSYIDENTPLHLACQAGAWNVVEVLLGAENSESTVEIVNEDGWNAVHFAARSGDIKSLELLKEAGVNLSVCDHNGKTPLDIAQEEEESEEIVSWLKEAGALEGGAEEVARPAVQLTQAQEYFHAHKVDEVLFNKGRLISIPTDSSVKGALQTLVEKRILSAPVFDAGQSKWNGLVDMSDLVALAISIFARRKKEDPTNLNKQFFNHPINQVRGNVAFSVIDFSKRNPFTPIKEGSELWSCVKYLGKGLHRVPVVDAEGQVVDIVTQSAVVKHLATMTEVLGDKVNSTVGELSLGIHDVVSIPHRERAFRAFELMAEKKVSAVALVDDNGVLVGSLSVSDLKLVLLDNDLMVLLLPSTTYMNKIRQASTGDLKASNIVCTTSTSLKNIIGKLAATKVHRLFVVDAESKPIGVVSLSDVFRTLISN